MSNSVQVGKSGFWRRQRESLGDTLNDEASDSAASPKGSNDIAPVTPNSSGASDTRPSTAPPTDVTPTSTMVSKTAADETKPKGSKMEIDALNERITELESMLAREREAFEKERKEFLTRPKLEDLGPEDLATESLGAVAEIIKAARAQSMELKRVAGEELSRAEEEAAAMRASAAAAADDVRRESERLAAEMASKAKAMQEKLIAESKAAAERNTANAEAAVEKLLGEAQIQRDSVIEEAQTRLESATNRSRKAVENANVTAQATLENARVGAARAREEARVAASETLKQCMSATDAHYQSLNELKVEIQAMESAFANFSSPLMNTLQRLNMDLAKIYNQADNASLVAHESRSDLSVLLEQSSAAVTVKNVASEDAVEPESEMEELPTPVEQRPRALAGGR